VTVLPCVQCGYDLSGLSPKGVCPECGAEVSRTLGAALRGASPAYRQRVRAGAVVLLASVQLLVAVPLVGALVSWATWYDIESILMCVVAAGLLAWGLACWLLTGRAPEGIEPRVRRLRAVSRASASVVVSVGAMVLASLLAPMSTPVWLVVLEVFSLGAALLAWVTLFDIVSDIAAATGDVPLRKRAERCGWWPVGLLMILPLGVVASFLTEQLGVDAEVGVGVAGGLIAAMMWADSSILLTRFIRRIGRGGPAGG
jgi:hypothetical protein